MTQITIRPATPTDAAGIATVHVRTWQCNFKGQVPDDYLDNLSIEQKTETWKQSLQNPEQGVYYFIAEAPGQIVGWCVAGKSRDDDSTVETGELHGIYILPEFIGQGIGTKLMEFALTYLRQDGFKNATLWNLDTNEATKKFYEKRGWQPDGHTKIDHRDGFSLHVSRYIITL